MVPITPPPLTVGIDIGAECTKVVLGTPFSCEIVRSNSGLHTTPTAVSFAGKVRQTGETASQKGKNGIFHLNRLVALQEGVEDFLEEFYPFDLKKATATEPTTVEVEYDGNARSFSAAAVLAMLLSNLQKNAVATMKRLQPDLPVDDTPIHYLLTVEPGTEPRVHQQLLDAAFAAGLTNVQIVDSATAYAATYQRKFSEFGVQEGPKTALFVDMGHTQTTVSVVQFASTPATDQEEGSSKKEPTTLQVLASKCSNTLGAVSIDKRLFYHFQSTVPALHDVKPKSRAGSRLLQGAHKLKHLLSQLPDGTVTVENVGDNDTDVSLQATRTTLAELCEPDAKILQELVQSVLAEAQLTTVDTVEVVGGGCRVPWVQTAIQQVLPDKILARSLDDTSAALGAALIGEKPCLDGLVLGTPEPTEADVQRRQALREQEVKMAELDLDEKVKSDIRNHMESLILELRSAKSNGGKHGDLLPSDNSLEEYLTSMDDWLFSEEAEEANRQAMELKWKEMQDKTQEMCGEYYKAVEEEQKAKEKEMEEAAKQAQLEQGMNGEDEEDHDNRRLPKKRRMEIVMKNKAEANELFKDGNWKFSAARYTKALSHCAKFVDLSPDDMKEVNELKVTLNLNLALAYTKMGNFDQCLRVCNEAIALDDTSAKAYYRRASTYYEKKKWDEAKQDITKAKKLAEGDKAIQKLSERIDLQLKKIKQKEKKMASKMFG